MYLYIDINIDRYTDCLYSISLQNTSVPLQPPGAPLLVQTGSLYGTHEGNNFLRRKDGEAGGRGGVDMICSNKRYVLEMLSC